MDLGSFKKVNFKLEPNKPGTGLSLQSWINKWKIRRPFPALSKSRKGKRRVLVFLRFKLILGERWVVQDCSNVHTVSISALTPVITS